MDVDAALYFRKPVEKLGIAPLTSMYLFGENTKNRFDDYRPEVHDSDGLLMHNGAGEWLWRPLDNAKFLRVSSFEDNNPSGFGLMQRDRSLEHYLDLRPTITSGRASGSSRRATGAKGRCSWWKSRRSRKSTTMWSHTGFRRKSRNRQRIPL